MPTIWDLLPASLWPMQPFTPPGNPDQASSWSLSLAAPWEAAASTPDYLTPDAPSPSGPWNDDRYRQMLADAKRASDFTAWTFGPPNATPRAAAAPSLRVGSNSVSDGPRELYQTGAPSPLPTTRYGVIPKNLPAQFRVPPPLSDWQKPESEFDIDAPRMAARVNRASAAGVNPIEIILNDTGARERRDTARAANFVFPGSGNFVSGDWSNITGDDVARLALSAASAAGPLALGNAARVGAAATRHRRRG